MKLAADENLDQRIIDGLLLRRPDLDILTVTQAGLSGSDDPGVLEGAAREGRLLFTHDRKTMINFAYERLAEGGTTPGVFIVPQRMSIGEAVEEILLIVEGSEQPEWERRITVLPL